jgi:hypothetical protein
MPRKITATDDCLQVYSQPDFASPAIAQIHKGESIELGDSSIHDGREWIGATLPDGRTGYVLGPSVRSHSTFGGDPALRDALKQIVEEEPNPPKPVEGTSAGQTVLGVVDLAATVLEFLE